ncbi:two-component regulator propeller domain-containing protein, partial [Fluviicola sp.]|uniref:ligand-binding sensor domain-containing protein n=1 Tax=Fluviicola sp. TaxID=1917219 RepID=UPI00261ACFA6
MKNRLIISLLVVIFFGTASYSQEIDWEPSNKVFSIEEGLPSSETYFVHQDREGYIWFCTDRGVVRYDGFHLQVFTIKDGLPDNVIFWIYEDHKGRIWFISYGGLLSYFENNKIVQYKYNHLISDHIGNNLYPHKTFSVDKQDNVYFGSGNTGILKIDAKGKSSLSFYKNDYCTFDLVNGTYLSTFNISKNQLIYPNSYIMNIRKDGNLVKKVTSKVVFKTYMPNSLSELKKVADIEISRIQDCFFDLRFPDDVVRIPGTTGYFPIGKDLWITTINGVYQLKDIPKYGFTKAPRIHYLKGYRVSSVLIDKEHGMWFSTLDKGVVYIPNMVVKNVVIYDNREALDATHVVVNAKNEVIYSNHLGVFRLKGNLPMFLTNGMSRNAISVFSDILLISKNKRSFSVKGKNWLIFNYYDCFNEADTSALICYSRVARIHKSGKVDTLYDYFAAKKYHKNLHHYFETVCSSDKGEVFAGNAKGLFRLKNGHWDNSMFPEILKNNRVSHIRFSKELGL